MFLALKEMKHAKARFVMIGTIIMLIAWLVFVLSGLGNGLTSLAAATMKNIDADYFIYEAGSDGEIMNTKVSGAIKEDLLALDEVEDATLMGQSSTAIYLSGKDATEGKTDVTFMGIEAGGFIEPTVIEGEQLNVDKPFGVIVNESMLDDGFAIGDKIIVNSSDNLELEIVGIVEGETFNHLPVVFANLEVWQSYAFAAPGSDNGYEHPVSVIALQGADINPEKIDATFDKIETVEKSAAVMGMPGYMEESGTIYMMLVFLMAISAIIIAVFFYVFILQKTQQFGVMKAIGASDKFIKRSIISQVFVLSAISIIIGAVLTYLTALVFPEGMPFDLDMKLVILYGILLLIISVLGSVISARQVSKIDPLTAIGRVE